MHLKYSQKELEIDFSWLAIVCGGQREYEPRLIFVHHQVRSCPEKTMYALLLLT